MRATLKRFMAWSQLRKQRMTVLLERLRHIFLISKEIQKTGQFSIFGMTDGNTKKRFRDDEFCVFSLSIARNYALGSARLS